MADALEDRLAALEALLHGLAPVRLAVSGGVDSMTLALIAGRSLGAAASMAHAVSPAVPPEATERVLAVGRKEGWVVEIVEAGEFEDEAYLGNPYDRCFHCKTRLYRAIAGKGPGTLLSGTNTDDLGDYRPGLVAARDHGVRHPFVEAGVDKPTVRALCRHLGYPELAALPAAPCLSSRVETGVRIEARLLALVHRVERDLTGAFDPLVVRCRVRRDAVAVEVDPATLEALSNGDGGRWEARIAALAREHGAPERVLFEPYRRGSAFVPPA
jgi:uncharacterized protein